MGIHGEPGALRLQTQNSRELIGLMVEKLLRSFDKNSRIALLVNNLGGFSALEMSVLTGEVLHSPLAEYVDLIVGPAVVVSALDMKGFSLSVLSLTDGFEQALLASVEASGWPAATFPHEPTIVKAENQLPEHHFIPSENTTVDAIITAVCETLISAEHELNALDALVGDGDTGSTFAGGAKRILAALQNRQLPLNQQEHLMSVIGEHLSIAMGGSSGVLMSIMFTAAGQKLAEGESLARSLMYGLGRMQHYGGAGIGDRTMIDALHPAFTCFVYGSSLKDMAQAAREGADSTSVMQEAKAGRSSYLNSDNLNGVKDPGAFAVEKVFEQLADRFS